MKSNSSSTSELLRNIFEKVSKTHKKKLTKKKKKLVLVKDSAMSETSPANKEQKAKVSRKKKDKLVLLK